MIDGRDLMPLLTGATEHSAHEVLLHYCEVFLHAGRWADRTRELQRLWGLGWGHCLLTTDQAPFTSYFTLPVCRCAGPVHFLYVLHSRPVNQEPGLAHFPVRHPQAPPTSCQSPSGPTHLPTCHPQDPHPLSLFLSAGGKLWKVHFTTPTFNPPGSGSCMGRVLCPCAGEVTEHDPPLLYELTSDPGEVRPLAPEAEPAHAEAVAKLRQEYDHQRRSLLHMTQQMGSLYNTWLP